MQIIGPFRVGPTQATQPTSRIPQTSGSETAGARGAGPIDQLDISPRAKAASAAGETSGPETVGGDIRLDKVAELRRQIASGTYDTPEKMDAALGRFLDQLG